jgi:hypothetical protein
VEHVTGVSFPYWEFGRDRMVGMVAAACDIDLAEAGLVVRSALEQYRSYGQITIWRDATGKVRIEAQDEATSVSDAIPLAASPQRQAHGMSEHDLVDSTDGRQPVHERLVSLCALLIPRTERLRLVRSWMDHLQCEREIGGHVRLTALVLVSTGVLPIALRARIERATHLLRRGTDA